jgi:hypothetical protein
MTKLVGEKNSSDHDRLVEIWAAGFMSDQVATTVS